MYYQKSKTMLYSTIGTTLFYILVFGTILYLAYKGEKFGNKKYIGYAYVLLILVTVLRYDIGNDYYGMAHHYLDDIRNGFSSGKSIVDQYLDMDGRVELSFYFFTWIFSWMPHPYVGVIGSYGIVSIYFLYKSLKRQSGYHTLGLLVYIVSGIMFNSWDWIRQSTAFMIVLYSIPFIENKDWKRYIVFILVASLFHNSALMMLPFFIVGFFQINKYIISISFLVSIGLFWTGILQNMLGDVTAYFAFIGGYESYADSLHALEQSESIMYKLRSLLYVGFYLLLVFSLPNSDNTKRNFLLIGSVLFLIASGSQILQRLSYYFLIGSIIALPAAYQNLKTSRKTGVIKNVLTISLCLLSFLWVRDIVTDNNRGCTPYDHIFSEHYDRQWFRPKSY